MAGNERQPGTGNEPPINIGQLRRFPHDARLVLELRELIRQTRLKPDQYGIQLPSAPQHKPYIDLLIEEQLPEARKITNQIIHPATLSFPDFMLKGLSFFDRQRKSQNR